MATEAELPKLGVLSEPLGLLPDEIGGGLYKRNVRADLSWRSGVANPGRSIAGALKRCVRNSGRANRDNGDNIKWQNNSAQNDFVIPIGETVPIISPSEFRRCFGGRPFRRA